MYLGWNVEPEIQPFNGLYYIKLTPDINGNYKEKTGPLLSNTWKCTRNNLFATAFLHSILKRLLHFHNLFVKLLATHYIDVSIHKHLLYCLPEMRSIKVSLNIMDLIEAQIRRYRNAEFLMKISRNAWKWYIIPLWQLCAAMMSWVRRWVELVVYQQF